jgi:hypothetical protein
VIPTLSSSKLHEVVKFLTKTEARAVRMQVDSQRCRLLLQDLRVLMRLNQSEAVGMGDSGEIGTGGKWAPGAEKRVGGVLAHLKKHRPWMIRKTSHDAVMSFVELNLVEGTSPTYTVSLTPNWFYNCKRSSSAEVIECAHYLIIPPCILTRRNSA